MKKVAQLTLTIFFSFVCLSILAQVNPPAGCDNLDFSRGDFSNWVGKQTVYPNDHPDANNCSGTGIQVANPNTDIVNPPYKCKRRINPNTGQYIVNSCNGCFSYPDWNYPVPPTASNVGPIPSYTKTIIEEGRLTIMKNQGETDPFTCGNVSTIPPGDKFSARIGNGGLNPTWPVPGVCGGWPGPPNSAKTYTTTQNPVAQKFPNGCVYPPNQPGWTDGVGFQIDYLSYKFTVNESNTLLTYKYAVVFQEPKDAAAGKHTENIAPRFTTTLRDNQGNVIGGQCGLIADIYRDDIPGYRECQPVDYQKLGGKVYGRDERIVYRSWTTVGIDLRKYIGTEVTLEFNTWDCGWGGHFGYAYVTAKCDAFELKAKSCGGDVTISAPAGFAYKWDNGETTKDVLIKNAVAGQTVSVDLLSVTGCVTTVTTSIYPSIVTAKFTSSENSVCLNKKVTFKDLSSSTNTQDNSDIPIEKVEWVFSDNDQDTVKSLSKVDVVHNFKEVGVHTIKAFVTSKLGCKASYQSTVEVTPGPTANFEWTDACVNKNVTFKNTSFVQAPQTITSYTWSYAGKTENTKDAVAAKYDLGGTYTVNLNVASTNGCTHDTTYNVRIWKLPKASFTTTPVCYGVPTEFTDVSILFDTDAKIPTWTWDFGDQTPNNIMQNSQHTYAEAGTYSVTLKIETDYGCEDEVTIEAKVLDKPNPDFSFDPACFGTPTNFKDLTPAADAITTWKWDFNDQGASATEQNPSHTYTLDATYNPTLTVATKEGCESSISHPLTLGGMPEASFDSDKKKSCAPMGVVFSDGSFSTSLGDSIVQWNWSFGDGGNSTSKNPTHLYEKPGVYSVSLTVVTAKGCTTSKNWPNMLEVYSYPIANFEPTPAETTDELPEIKFINQSIDNETDDWAFGVDGATSVEKNPSYSYADVGTYDVTLTVTNINNCKDKITKPVVIKPTWSFYIPNAFSPGISGGINDGFIGVGVNITDYQMWIFDRWGQKVYYTDDITKPWNGYKDNAFKSGDEKLYKQDVYVWKVKFKDPKGKVHQKVGHVTALR